MILHLNHQQLLNGNNLAYIMRIDYRQASLEDAELLINIYDASFYDDYLRYGSCPGYGLKKEKMEE